MTLTNPKTRASILARMVAKAPGEKLGRTQVMKLFYFLQELKGVPLGYDFRLFTYGPFDSEVLGDLGVACVSNAVQERTVIYPRGYGYEITAGANAGQLNRFLEENESELADAVDSVVGDFSSCTAAELELQSTIFFVDRELISTTASTDLADLAGRVHQIKPHFAVPAIEARIQKMLEKGWLQSLTSVSA